MSSFITTKSFFSGLVNIRSRGCRGMKETGKRDKCACGSSKPYEKCCGMPAKVVSLAQFRWQRVGQQLRRKLGEFADQPFLAREAARAQQLYMEKIDPELIDQYDEFIMERCFEWFIFDYRLSTGETVIELFQKSPDLSGQEKELLKGWASARISLYEVLDIPPREGLALQDLIRLTGVTVYDLNAAQELYPGMVLLMRVLKVGEAYEFSTSGLALPAPCRDVLLERVQGDLKTYCRERGTSIREGVNSYLKIRAYLLNAWVIEMGLSYILPDMISNDSEDYTPVKPDYDPVPDQIARELTNVFLDDYYDRWLDHPLSVLNGLTPRQACRSTEGKERLKEMLRELEQVEIEREYNSEPAYDFQKVWRELGLARGRIGKGGATLSLVKNEVPDDYQWPFPGCLQVARQVMEDLKLKGCSHQQLGSALRLWHDYCWLGRPSFRKSAVWVASVIYTMARLELDRKVNQHDLAARYGVASSSISLNFRNLCRTLGLVAFDHRYSTHRPVFPGPNRDYPLLDRIWKKLKL